MCGGGGDGGGWGEGGGWLSNKRCLLTIYFFLFLLHSTACKLSPVWLRSLVKARYLNMTGNLD